MLLLIYDTMIALILMLSSVYKQLSIFCLQRCFSKYRRPAATESEILRRGGGGREKAGGRDMGGEGEKGPAAVETSEKVLVRKYEIFDYFGTTFCQGLISRIIRCFLFHRGARLAAPSMSIFG